MITYFHTEYLFIYFALSGIVTCALTFFGVHWQPSGVTKLSSFLLSASKSIVAEWFTESFEQHS